jgi:hypothetical protein
VPTFGRLRVFARGFGQVPLQVAITPAGPSYRIGARRAAAITFVATPPQPPLLPLGTGIDKIVFAVSPYATFIGQETISGFSTQHDVIKINHTLIGSFAGASGSVQADAHKVGSDTVITIDASNQITLTGVALSSLHSHNFVFV